MSSPEPLVPMIQLKDIKGPITLLPRHDLKFSTSICFKKPIFLLPEVPLEAGRRESSEHTVVGTR